MATDSYSSRKDSKVHSGSVKRIYKKDNRASYLVTEGNINLHVPIFTINPKLNDYREILFIFNSKNKSYR